MKDAPTSTPLFLRLAPHRGRCRILDLESLPGAAGAVSRAEPLRHDALAAELAGLAIDDRAGADVMLVERDAGVRLTQQLSQHSLALFDRQSAHLLVVKFRQIEGESTACEPERRRRINSNTASPLSSQTIASPSIRQERAGSIATAATTSGNRAVKSWPPRVKSRTPAASRGARMRKPSCLISCSQSGPAGGALAGDGKQGSMKPIARPLRCNMTPS